MRPAADHGVTEESHYHDEEEVTRVHQVEVDHRLVMLRGEIKEAS